MIEIKVGARFRGKINGVIFEVTKIWTDSGTEFLEIYVPRIDKYFKHTKRYFSNLLLEEIKDEN